MRWLMRAGIVLVLALAITKVVGIGGPTAGASVNANARVLCGTERWTVKTALRRTRIKMPATRCGFAPAPP
jgi:hypothetical protein